MKYIRSGHYPSNTGWSFPDPSAGVIHGDGFEDLVDRVIVFRNRNGLPPGDPVREVTDYICEQNPSVCKELVRPLASPVPPAPATTPASPLGERVAEWIAGYLPGAPVPPDVIRARAEACRQCPLNVPFPIGCPPCQKKTHREITRASAGYPRRSVDGLLACSRYVWPNAVAVGADISHDPSAPPGCWRGTPP